MDLKVYKKEEVLQPQGKEYVYVPDVIDIVPEMLEVEATHNVKNNIWFLENLKLVADVEIKNNKLIIKSDKVRYENGNLYVTITKDQVANATLVDEDSKESVEQECALATIYQRGLDPLDVEDGIRWSEAVLEEINSLQLMQDITDSVSKVTSSVQVVFDTVTDENNVSYLTYKLKEVA